MELRAAELRAATGRLGDYEITVGRIRLAADLTLDQGLDILDAQLRMALALEAKEHVFVHAGAVAVNGRGLILPGRTFTGKSTLTRALVEQGANYYSDEFAVLDAQGCLHPYTRPLSIRHAQPAGGAAALDPARLTATIGGEPVPVSVIAALEYRADSGALQCEIVPATGGLTAILENCAAARSAPERVMAAARRAASGATTVRGLRGEAGAAARALLQFVREAG